MLGILGKACKKTISNNRAQVLLPAVLLAPIFILVIYLLFETSKVSMYKIRNQFALDNAVYSQMSSVTVYLNALAYINGNSPYRVMKSYNSDYLSPKGAAGTKGKYTVFDVFYQAGAFPALGPDHGDKAGFNPNPAPESDDWDYAYYQDKRKNWIKEQPSESPDEEGRYVLTSKAIADENFFPSTTIGIPTLQQYILVYLLLGQIYQSQTFSFQDTTRNARMFREAYYLNSPSCRTQQDCARQSAAIIANYINMQSKPFEIEKVRAYFSEDIGTTMTSAYPVDLDMSVDVKKKLFQFAYLDSSSLDKLKKLRNGIKLEQGYQLPLNNFDINLTVKYKPKVRTQVGLQCPRSGNNCVWPNPLPKYSVRMQPS